MPKRLSGTNHVNLSVTDLDRSTEWYCRVLGLTVVSNHTNIGPPYFTDATYNGLFDLTTFSYVIALLQHPGAGQPYEPGQAGLDHVGFTVPEVTDLPDWVEHLDAEGVAHSGIVHAPYGDVISFRDPDGIPLELFAVNVGFWAARVAEAHQG